MTTIYERDNCRLTLELGDRIEYTLEADSRHVVSTPLNGLTALVTYLEPGGAEDGSARLATASRAAAVRDGFERYAAGTIAAELRRWCHQAGLSAEWSIDGRSTHREHIITTVPQPCTGRTVTLSVAFWTPGDADEISFTEEYRAPAEILGYSYGIGLPYDALPHLLEADHTPGNPEHRLVAAIQELVANGTINPLAGQGVVRDLFEGWCRESGVRSRPRGIDRREPLIQVPTRSDQQAAVSLTIGSATRQIGFQEGWGPDGQPWRDALYQLQFDHDQLDTLLPWLTNRAGPIDDRLQPDDAMVAAWRVLAERGELTPRRPMEIRDRVAGWLTEAGVTFRSYGSAWRETLLRVHRPNDCIFTLTLTIDPDARAKGILFTEFYDYGPSGDDPGREYGYSVHAPYADLDVLADAYAPGTAGPAPERLIGAFKDLVAAGVLGDGMALKANQAVVLRDFRAAGVDATPDVWVWLNSD
ncbi:hypothetical protein [Kribbella solani]|uniref:Uncharacterized protein n=1 Tax=Kribbella solani TaxID=236067 RepID=A0A841DYX5_9ACTN|nr:hypothetical protein [Kribbella solani]MBB5980428.1 hypothetical protein [Kribbella solani]